MKLIYFAWLRERIGIAEETVTPPASVTDVTSLIEWLKGRGPGYALALAKPEAIRVAVNQQYRKGPAPIAASDEVALFPPVTGG